MLIVRTKRDLFTRVYLPSECFEVPNSLTKITVQFLSLLPDSMIRPGKEFEHIIIYDWDQGGWISLKKKRGMENSKWIIDPPPLPTPKEKKL